MNAANYALAAWSNAERHLREAESQNPDVSPLATVHIAYYSMFHAARAVLLRQAGSAPKKHGSVVGQFGLLAKSGTPELKAAASDLRKAQDQRILGDYGNAGDLTVQTATETRQKAVAFLDLCSREFSFAREEKRIG